MSRIALVDFIVGGHHLAFMRLFTKALAELGHEVWVFYPEEKNIKAWTSENVKSKGIIHFSNINIKQRKFNLLDPVNDVLSSMLLWYQVGKAIEKKEKSVGQKIDFTFLAWLDSFLACNFPIFIQTMIFRKKWSGLYFHPYHLRLQPECLYQKSKLSSVDYLLTSKKCISVAIHDRTVADSFSSNRLSGKKVVVLPETADTSPADSTNKLAKKIKEQSRGKLIVGSIGLSPHQGLITLIQTALKANADDYFFVFIGKIESTYFTDEENVLIDSFIKSLPSNCFMHQDSIPEGTFYNSVFSVLDIVFLVYNNFISTSNRLTKAAIFEKLVLAQNNYCIGDDVQRYNLGLTVPPGNSKKCIEALSLLKENVSDGGRMPMFSVYREENDFKKLLEKLNEVGLGY